jgi:hypothetical protein
MSHNDKAAVDTAKQAPVDIDNVFNDIHDDRVRFTKESNSNKAIQTKQLAEQGILPAIAIF